MNDWQLELPKKYPLTLKYLSYFECNDGWANLLDSLCSKIENYLQSNKIEDLHAIQVKEKFGSLRFYMSSHDDTVEELISLAEEESSNTCEICGQPGKTHQSRGWLKTVCSQHQELFKK